MKLLKKGVILLSSIFIALSLTSCFKNPNLVIVGSPREVIDVVKNLVEEFQDKYNKENKENPLDFKVIEFADVSVTDMAENDRDNLPDLFQFPNDITARLVRAGALLPIVDGKETDTKFLSNMINSHTEPSIQATKVGETYYAYPMQGDNGYFMYYDKSKLSNHELLNFNKIFEKANSLGKKVQFDLENSWYLAGFFFGAGVRYNVDYSEDGTTETNVWADFNGPSGYKAGKYLLEFSKEPSLLIGTDDKLTAGFKDGSAIAGITGIWQKATYEKLLGSNLGAIKLPKFTVPGTNEDIQMGSFSGFKLLGVKKTTKQVKASLELGQFLSSKYAQKKRYEATGFIPTIKSLVDTSSPEYVLGNDEVGLALAEQNSLPCAVPQQNVPNNFWNALGAFGADLAKKNGPININNLQEILNRVNTIMTGKESLKIVNYFGNIIKIKMKKEDIYG